MHKSITLGLTPAHLSMKFFGYKDDISLLTVSLGYAIMPKSTINVR